MKQKRKVRHEAKDSRRNVCSCGARFKSAREFRHHLMQKSADGE